MNPTAQNYNALSAAYDYFNRELFEGLLPGCLITLQRHKGAYGYFAPERFGSRDEIDTLDEIALNPSTFASRTLKAILSTLVHEQAHLWQQHFGKPSRNGYHNKEWGAKMKELGLYPSSTGEPGGKETGQKVSHYIIEGGPFDRAFRAGSFDELPVERWSDEEREKKAAQKSASKTKFSCPECGQNAWAKPEAFLKCALCEETMECAA